MRTFFGAKVIGGRRKSGNRAGKNSIFSMILKIMFFKGCARHVSGTRKWKFLKE
jgi:hypothetical protein